MNNFLDELLMLHKELASCPPSAKNWIRRQPLLTQMDALFSIPESENSDSLHDFYRHECLRTLNEIRTCSENRARVWKLYSSAILIRDISGRVIGFDLNDGCTPLDRRTRLRLDADLIAAFAETVDIMFYTHGHLDHIGLGVIDSLLAHGKQVVMPQDIIRHWLFPGAIPAEDCKIPGVSCYFGKQIMSDGERNIPNAAYIVKLESGFSVFLRGDIYHYEELCPILDQIQAEGHQVDLAATSPFYQSGPEILAELFQRFHCHFLPIHEWEFSHRQPQGKAGAATQTFQELYKTFRKYGEMGKCDILAWGESRNF